MSFLFDLSPAVSIIPMLVMLVFCWFMVWSNMRIRKLCNERVSNIESAHEILIRDLKSEHDAVVREMDSKYRALAKAHDLLMDQYRQVSSVIGSISDAHLHGVSPTVHPEISFYFLEHGAEVSPIDRPGEPVLSRSVHGQMANYRLDVWLYVPSQREVSIEVLRPSLIAFGAKLFADSVEKEYAKSNGGSDARV